MQSKVTLTELKLRFSLIASIIIFAILARLVIPHYFGYPANFSPVDAIALFSGAVFASRLSAFIVTFLAIWLGDLFLNRIYLEHWALFYQGFYWQYGSYLLITLIGSVFIKRISPLNVVAASILSASLFFIVSNFGVWLSGLLYPLTVEGLIACYLAAIPFFKNSLLSDLFYSMLMFGSFAWAQRKLPIFRSSAT